MAFTITDEERRQLFIFIGQNPDAVIALIEARFTREQVSMFIKRANEIPKRVSQFKAKLGELSVTSIDAEQLNQDMINFAGGVE